MQNWKTEALLVLALSLLLVNDGSAAIPTKDEVSSVIRKAKSENAAKRLANIHNRARRNALEGGVRSKCPGLLSNYHGTAEAYNEANVVIAEDTLLATKLLMDKGYTLLELQTPAVTAMFQSQIGCSSPTVSCDPNQKYRTIDGSCNNLNNPTWGMAGTQEIRDLDEVAYDDGLGLPCTKSVGGGQLPSPRKISNTVNNQDNDIFSDRLSAMVFAWGQFLDHDIALTPEAELVDNCCASSEANNEHCFNIEIEDDTDMIQNGADCMPFTRSAAAPVCGPGRREQPNSITHYIDSSNIYGSSPEKLAELRIENTGFLRMKKITTRGVGSYWRLPDDDTPDVHLCEKDEENGFSCSLAGDGRVNDVPTLTSMHQLGVKEHNRIASKLKKYFKDPEVLFQETRKIVMAEFQHITYNGFLPKIFSPDKMAEFGLWSTATYRYNESTKAILSNEMGLAFRMHSLIPSDIKILTQDFNPVVGRNGEIDPDTDKPADDTFFKMDMTYFHKKVGKKRKSRLQGLNGLLYYSAATPAQAMDRHLVDSVRNKLFKDTDTNTALDLAALNIQRGRDHGLPSYNEYRKFCGLSTGSITCDDLTDHDDATIELLRTAYNNECNDIDFWVGAYTEKPSPGAVVGPLLQCVLLRQFQRFKYGDRFWYQNADAGFTPAQLVEIQKASLARLLCDNMEFKTVAPDSFAKPDRSNFVPCSKIPKVKLGPFKRSPLQDQDSSSSTDDDSSRDDSSEDDSDCGKNEFPESQEDSSSDDSSSS